MVFFFSPKKNDSVPDDDHQDKRVATKRYKEALRQHTSALKGLSESIDACVRSLEAVAVSFCALAADTDQPAAISVAGALRRSLGEFHEGRELEELQEEIEHSLGERFAGLDREQKELEDNRKRRATSKKRLETLQSECAKLEKRSDSTPKAQETLQAERQRLEKQEVEFRRFDSEFLDAFNNFTQRLGCAVYDDVKELSVSIHCVMSLLSFQFRKCHENLTQKRVGASTDGSPSEGLSTSVTPIAGA